MRGMPTLRQPQDLDRVFREGRWQRLQPVAVGVLHRDDEEQSRFAFVAGRRVGKAVRRNRARRRMREAVRSMMGDICAGADIVLAARPETVETDFRQLRQAIRRALEAEGLLTAQAAEGV